MHHSHADDLQLQMSVSQTNIWASSLYAVLYKSCQILGNCGHAKTWKQQDIIHACQLYGK